VGAIGRIVVLVFGAALLIAGLVIWSTGGLTIPARTPPGQFQFTGLALVLLGAAPALVGVMALAIGLGVLRRQADAIFTLLILAQVSCALAFLLAPKH